MQRPGLLIYYGINTNLILWVADKNGHILGHMLFSLVQLSIIKGLDDSYATHPIYRIYLL